MREVDCSETDAVGLCVFHYMDFFRILHSNGFTEEEINEKKAVIYSNTVTSMCSILKAMENILKIPLENTEREVKHFK